MRFGLKVNPGTWNEATRWAGIADRPTSKAQRRAYAHRPSWRSARPVALAIDDEEKQFTDALIAGLGVVLTGRQRLSTAVEGPGTAGRARPSDGRRSMGQLCCAAMERPAR